VKYDLTIANIIDLDNLSTKVLDTALNNMTVFWTACFANLYA